MNVTLGGGKGSSSCHGPTAFFRDPSESYRVQGLMSTWKERGWKDEDQKLGTCSSYWKLHDSMPIRIYCRAS